MPASVESPAEAGQRAPGGSSRARLDTRLPAALLLVTVTVVWIWWAWDQGAYFGVVFYPGAIVLGVVALLLLGTTPWRASLRLSRATVAALGALTLLGGWTLLSALWSPAPEEAFSDGGRVILYAGSFGLGLWLCHLLAGRMLLSLLPLAVAGGLAGLATAITLIAGDDLTRYLETNGSLDFPIGYRNANAAFFFIAMWPAISLAAARVDWRLRGAMLGCAVLCAEIAFLSQSRGSILALLPAAFVWLLLSPWRLRALAWLALAVAVAVAALPWLVDVYATFNADESVHPALPDAGWAMILTSAAGVVVGAAAARLEPVARRPPAVSRPLLPALAAGIGVVLAAAAAVFLLAGTDPVDWVDQRASEFGRNRSPDLSKKASRFGVDATSQRPDQWRVAWADAREAPLLGKGAGAFEYSYVRERRIQLIARDAHSVEMELLSELGFPALVMFGVVAVGASAGALRSRRLGPAAATVSAAALASGAYWLVHASIDWFWTYPALTAPMFGLLGSAAAPAVLDSDHGGRGRLAMALAVICAIAVALPLYLSERFTKEAYGESQSDLERAYRDLDIAEALNPFSDEPLLAEGAIAREAGERQRAIEAFRAAAERKPEEWAAHYLLGRLLARDDPVAAERELAIAAALNPRSAPVRHALAELREPGAAEAPRGPPRK